MKIFTTIVCILLIIISFIVVVYNSIKIIKILIDKHKNKNISSDISINDKDNIDNN